MSQQKAKNQNGDIVYLTVTNRKKQTPEPPETTETAETPESVE